ncbi:MAG: YbaB/EbfC family nucleoid-associated protein [Chloroflexi bacterium]|nr:YbaB/EbfC family nucleoid-associated protein [Chloroflexota bacterium]
MMRQVQQLQGRLEKAKAELAAMSVEGTAGGGAVTVVMDGHQRVRAVRIAPEAVDPADVETLQEMVMAAVNDAAERSQALMAKHLGAITGGLGLPGI